MLSRSRFLRAPRVEDVVAAFKVMGLPFNPALPASSRPTSDDVRSKYRDLARLHHPDLGGDDARMKVINTAYELIQSSGALQGAYDSRPCVNSEAKANGNAASSPEDRFHRKAGTRRRRVPDDFASGDDASWSMKSSLDWTAMMNSTENVTEEEMKNPANHPFSHSRFFTFEEDTSIYRMIRGGATVPQVARTLGKPATFIERRLQNAQFKLRIQYVLRNEKRQKSSHGKIRKDLEKDPEGNAQTTSTPITESFRRRVVRQSPFDTGLAAGVPQPERRKKEWEATYPDWSRASKYRQEMSLEEQGLADGLLRARGDRGTQTALRHGVSKMGRSYSHYQRLSGNKGRKNSTSL